ncbi:MAG: Hpt domain-containing protein [Planctomycetes bacterium]|nr:Hpt domain-containing protein [Planctomycetota bacterium]
MRLRSKVLCGVVLGVAGLGAGIYVATGALVMDGLAQSERSDADAGTRQTGEVVATMLDEYLVRMNDWANWDDMAQFVADGNQEFVDANIEAGAMAGLQWDTVMVARPGAEDRLLTALDPARTQFVTADPALVAELRDPTTHGALGAPRSGLLVIGDTVWITASRDVRRTDGSEPEQQGRFATCARINDDWMSRLRKFTARQVRLQRAGAAPVDALEWTARGRLGMQLGAVVTLVGDDDHISTFAWLPDVHGRPAVLLREDRERPLLAQGRQILASSLLVVVVGGFLLVGLALLGTGHVLRRLGALQAGVDALRAGSHEPVPIPVADEIGALAGAFNHMAAQIVDRETALRALNGRLQLVLDAIGDGLVTLRLDGSIDATTKRATAWFGAVENGLVWDWLFAADDMRRVEFQLGFSQIADAFLPLELLLDQLPRRCQRGESTYELKFLPIEADGKLTGLLLVITDITAAVANERAQHAAAELQSIVANYVRDPDEFERFLGEMDTLLERVVHGPDEDVLRRQLHTMKGNAAVYGFTAFADVCHAVETALGEGQALALHAATMQSAWAEAVQRVRSVLPGDGRMRVQLSLEEHERFLARLRDGADLAELIDIVASWRLQPVATAFARLGQKAERVAAAIGKHITIECHDDGLRVDGDTMGPFWDTLLHVVRNAIDHGIESADERERRHKPAAGRLLFTARRSGDHLTINVTDDGAGIDWTRITEVARQRGMAHTTHQDLVAALFADGVSSRDHVTEFSGRGVGMAAVRAVTNELGGSIEVKSQPGIGTTIALQLPLAVCQGAPAQTLVATPR